jgi:hypothetical protein
MCSWIWNAAVTDLRLSDATKLDNEIFFLSVVRFSKSRINEWIYNCDFTFIKIILVNINQWWEFYDSDIQV